ncbi:hypothetical protein HPB48_020538 [Haemaphysalis longicornis]|uniref:DDE-1 domain-containing protein n=1 Tax=Haemaphysalis longicornis TaxID=44386 RepID=A0A9J6FWL1_HAELO|nr:hypothetical protein HPB48_020538 [Haemaphysalis longicornis]
MNEEVYMDKAMMLEWIRVVRNRRPRRMLVLDAFHGHLTEAVKRVLCDEKMDLDIILDGVMSTLQLLDIMLNKPFKDQVWLEYQGWMSSDSPETPTSHLQRPLLENHLQPGALHLVFFARRDGAECIKECCFSNSLNSTEDDTLWEAASKKRLSSEDSGTSDE